MKTPEKNSKSDPKKQKKQIIALGVLSALFVAVMIVQFGGPKPQYEVAALAIAPDSVQPAADVPPVPTEQTAQDNTVLSEPSNPEGLKRSPFANFWSAPSSNPAAVPDVAAPSLTVNATLPSTTRGMAVIDGELHFVGDTIGGWQLSEVRPRAIVLRGPNATSQVVIDMPILEGKVVLPALAPAAPQASASPAAAAPSAPTAPKGR